MFRRIRTGRKGISTIVGTVLFIGIFIAGFNLMTWGVVVYDDYTQVVMERNEAELGRLQENINIVEARIDSNKLNVTVENSGPTTARLVRLWVTNETANPSWRQYYDLNTYVNPRQKATNIGQDLPLTASSANAYDLKISTERGNKAEYEIFSNLQARVMLIAPSTIYPGAEVTLALAISNNATANGNIVDLTPTLSVSGTPAPTYVSGPTPSKVASLPDGNTAIFRWVYDTDATETTLTFNGSFTGAPSGVYSTADVDVSSPESAAAASISTFASAAKRLGLLISGISNPMDTQGGGYGKWGIGVVNPLNRTISIYGVGISTPTHELFQGPVGNTPSTGWDLYRTATQSVVYWQGPSVNVDPYEAQEFTVEIQGKTSAKIVPIYIEALTSEGKFTLTHTVSLGNTFPTMSLYYTGNPSNPNSDWKFIMPDIPGGAPRTFNVTVENTSTNDPLPSSVLLQIIVPMDFDNVTANPVQSGWNTPTLLENPDGSTLITVQTSATSIPEGSIYVFQFDATPPTVSSPFIFVFTTTTVYPEWTDIRVASAISEAAVVVVP
ncbi:MAG: hypothetical protein ACE5PO_02160 [Candidatus Bathyarchaeia archaeon]